MGEKVLLIILGILLLFCSAQDLWRKKVYLWVLGLGGTLILACLPFCEKVVLMSRVGGLIVGLVVIMISKITAGKIGMGDGILLCVTGIGLGFWANMELFGIALSLAAVLSIILLMLHIVDRKKSIPFIPFLFAGYLILFVSSGGVMI
jgi:leader peptidase (prepilin peptidase)/N-methyltransferase